MFLRKSRRILDFWQRGMARFPMYGDDRPALDGADNFPQRVPWMGARFAGSQRLGDRRRRRLAVESDDPSATANWSDPLPAPAGVTRTAEAPHADDPPRGGDDHSLGLAAVKIVPPEWWKY